MSPGEHLQHATPVESEAIDQQQRPEQARKEPELQAPPETSAVAYYEAVTGIKARSWAGAGHSLEQEAEQLKEDARILRAYQPEGKPSTSQQGRKRSRRTLAEDRPLREDAPPSGGGSIGYQLLKKAGWKGRGGLGAQEQGIAVPIQAWVQSGRRGIGTREATRPEIEAEAGASEAATGSKTKSSEGTKAEAPRQAKAPRREWETVRVEESVDTKVKRWRQVMQAEADEKVSKAIDRYMFRAFRDDSSDSNPLLRKHNLSMSNPLL